MQAVCCEPVSPEFPVKQGKYREFAQITPKSGPHVLYKDLNFLVLLVEFPTRRNRELFRRNREFFVQIREFGAGSRSNAV